MNKVVGILFLAILLAMPLSASAGYIGTYYMNVDASSPDWYNWHADYDGTIGGDSDEIFCVENVNMNGSNVLYDFYTIDGSLGGGVPISDLEKATWYAHWYETSAGTENDKLNAQTAIWKTMFGNAVTAPSNVDLFKDYDGASDKGDYVDQWLLAVLDSDNTPNTITWNTGGQNYLVPTSAIPEPANMLLLGTGLLGLVALGRKKIFKK